MSGMQDKAQELLNQADNKYQLVLTVARRAKSIKDDPMLMSSPEASKPIKLALRELADHQREQAEAAAI
ncbi:MAG: DNA-directed RNA polymerase subunit omega [Candidatus Sericytochromatia bacterium]|nr:DNA-directed RNA polymerase subunit omega [Candidatus Sericytochromatia bacterium]